MQFVRKFFLVIASSLLGFSLLFTAFWITATSLNNRDTVKNWISDSGAYDNFVDQIVEGAQRDLDDNSKPQAAQSSIDTPTLSNAAQEAFPPALLQTSLESVVDGAYDWLEEDTDSLEFSVDFTEAKNNLADSLSVEAIERAEGLPRCDNFEIPVDLEIFALKCVPQGVDVNILADNFKSELLRSDDFLPDTELSSSDLKLEAPGSDEQKSISELSRTNLKDIPRYFGLVKVLTWFVIGASIVLAVSVLLFSSTRRKGVKHLAKAFAVSSISIAIGAFILNGLPINLGNNGQSDTNGNFTAEAFASNIAEPILNEAAGSIISYQVWFSVGYGLIALALISYLILTRDRTLKTAKNLSPIEGEPQLPAPGDDLDVNSVSEQLSKNKARDTPPEQKI